MDCNQVFTILTRGPFPTGEPWDEEVEAHLEMCADCWRLAEALRPALEVFQEAVPAAESRDLPGYWGDARPSSQVVAELARGMTHTALATGPRNAYRPTREYPSGIAGDELSPALLRAMALAATVTAAALVLIMLFRA